MQITTRTAVIPKEAIQAAYNDAVMLGLTALAQEIAQLWLSALVEQSTGDRGSRFTLSTGWPPSIGIGGRFALGFRTSIVAS